MSDQFNQFRSDVWVVDFEFTSRPGEKPIPICMAAKEVISGQSVELAGDELVSSSSPPFPVSSDALVVAFFLTAEISCFISLGWNLPQRALDLFVEFSREVCGLRVPAGKGLLGALKYYGLTGMDATEKVSMRNLAMRGGPFSPTELSDLAAYCRADVSSTCELLAAMWDDLDVPRALLRGRQMVAAGVVESTGIPVDRELANQLQQHSYELQHSLIAEVDCAFGAFDGRSFRLDRWEEFLQREGIPWPVNESGKALSLKDSTFREMAQAYPCVKPMKQLRATLSQLRLNDLPVGEDGRNRCLLSPFASRTGRFQPSTSRCAFGLSSSLRGLIRPEPGRAIAYVDFAGQEYGIGAALSGDDAMMEDYRSGDPYLGFGKRAGLVPRTATKSSHGAVRSKLKVALGLGAMYGAGAYRIAMLMGESEPYARHLLQLHRRTYPRYWDWSDAVLRHAMMHNRLETVFGWQMHVTAESKPTSLRNFVMQANGAEMLRLALCLTTEAGIEVHAPVHDAVLVGGTVDEIEDVAAVSQQLMAEASAIVLDGFELRTDAEIVRYPDRFAETRGQTLWAKLMLVLRDITATERSCVVAGSGEDG